MTKLGCVVTALILFLVSAAAPLAAQTTTAQLSGTVVDPSASVVKDAKVTVQNEATSDTRTTVTNETGSFVLPALVPGSYRITIKAPGFKTTEQRGIVLTANDRRSLGSIVLQLGTVTESLTVEAQAVQIQTSSAENASLLAPADLDMLSTRGRDVISLLKLLPGVTPGADVESLGGNYGTSTPAINGQTARFNQMTLDGQSGTDNDITDAFNQTTSMDAIAEVKVMLNNYQAEYGRNAGAVINLISKSGTQAFHGSAYWYRRNEALNANDFFSNRNGSKIDPITGKLVPVSPRPLYRYDIFGGTIGGPVFIPGVFNTSKTKLFAFYSREDQLSHTPAGLRTVTMPTQLERAGDFSETLDVSGKLIPIKDPTTGLQFPGNRIPAVRINRNGQAMLNIFNLPNFFNRAISGGNYNYQWEQMVEVPKKQNLLKIDFNPTDKDRISVRPRDWWADTRQFNDWGWNICNWDFVRGFYIFTEKSVEVGWTRLVAPTIVNEFGVGFRALHEDSTKRSPDQYKRMTRSVQGLSGLGQWYADQNTDNLIPAMSFGGVPNAANIGAEWINRIPIDARDFRYTALDNLSVNWQQHAFKFGYYYEFNVGSEGPRGNVFGNFSFAKDTNNALDSNYAYANALLANFTSYTEANRRNVARHLFSLTEWFAQDSWKVTRTLTLELGLRFSVAPPIRFPDGDAGAFFPSLYDAKKAPQLIQPTRVDGKRLGLNPVTGAVMPAATIGFYAPNSGDPVNGLRAASQPGYQSFNEGSGLRLSPRFGFGWDVLGDGKTAIRGGVSVTRNPIQSNGTWGGVYATPPAMFNPTLYYGDLDTFTTSAGLLSAPNVATYGPEWKTPTTYSWSLFVQRDLGHALLGSVGYVGNQARHLLVTRALNQLPYGTRFLASSADPTNPGFPLADIFLRTYPGFNNITRYSGDGTSNYNALQASLNRRFTEKFQLGVGYTWSKAMSNGTNVPMFLNNRTWNYGKAGIDRTHVLTANFTYDIPKLGSLIQHAAVRAVFDGWQLSGIATFASGAPQGMSFSTVSGADLTGGGDGQRVNLTGPIVTNSHLFSQWFNTENVAVPAKGDIGNAAPDVFRGPGTNNWDLTAFKNFKVKEKANFQLRWEAYNAFNHTQWAGVNSAARFDNSGKQVNALFGTVTSSRTPRVMQGSLRFQF